MKILLTGATGYIGRRLLQVLLESGYQVICAVRDNSRLDIGKYNSGQVTAVECDLMKLESLASLPKDITVAYYLVHSMSMSDGDFSKEEISSAANFIAYMNTTQARQIIYLGGITNDQKLSKHLASRKAVENELRKSSVPVTALRAGIIVGSGSSSFEIIRDLVEKLPVMVAPKWLKTKCQPIAIRNVIEFLTGVINNESTYGKHFDIYGPEILTYKQMLLKFAEARKLKRLILTVPVMTPKLSSYWLYFVTSTAYPLAKNLVDSMKVDVVGENNDLAERLGIRLLSYQESIRIAFDKIEQNMVLSTWSDAMNNRFFDKKLGSQIEVPKYGVFTDRRSMHTDNEKAALGKIFAIGGKNGWYYANWLWSFRGFFDRLFGGVGLGRGRRNNAEVSQGDILDFWRVIYANKEEHRLLLFAEMKIPGEAWLEFSIDKKNTVHQTATFRPLGLAGRLYWYAMLPFHFFIFRGMLRRIV
jgi:uncharacterized protein YbjT (DUF2867 family)